MIPRSSRLHSRLRQKGDVSHQLSGGHRQCLCFEAFFRVWSNQLLIPSSTRLCSKLTLQRELSHQLVGVDWQFPSLDFPSVQVDFVFFAFGSSRFRVELTLQSEPCQRLLRVSRQLFYLEDFLFLRLEYLYLTLRVPGLYPKVRLRVNRLVRVHRLYLAVFHLQLELLFSQVRSARRDSRLRGRREIVSRVLLGVLRNLLHLEFLNL